MVMTKDEIKFEKIYSDESNNEKSLDEVYECIFNQLNLDNTNTQY